MNLTPRTKTFSSVIGNASKDLVELRSRRNVARPSPSLFEICCLVFWVERIHGWEEPSHTTSIVSCCREEIDPSSQKESIALFFWCFSVQILTSGSYFAVIETWHIYTDHRYPIDGNVQTKPLSVLKDGWTERSRWLTKLLNNFLLFPSNQKKYDHLFN